MLEQLVYISTATGSTGSLLNMVTLLAESQRNNAGAGLTGALGAHAGRFHQVIEGEGEALDGLMRRLAGDPRHRDIRILGRDRIEARSFADWSMANALFTPAQRAELEALEADEPPSSARIVALLRSAVNKAAP